MKTSEPHIFRYGTPDETLMELAMANFTAGQYSRFSFCTTPVEILSIDGKNTVGSHGTGFFWHEGGRDWVITCWHVISGRNPFTGAFMSSQNIIPQNVRVWGWRIRSLPGNKISQQRIAWTLTLPPGAIELFSKPPMADGKAVDIVAIPLPPNVAMDVQVEGNALATFGTMKPGLNQQALDQIVSSAGDECVILGYPLQNYSGNFLPIWKLGSLASDTNMSLDGTPAFLIDAATSAAMSGSPVLRRSAAIPEVDKYTQIITEHRGYQIVGVYAGRLQNKELERINIGYAWFSSLIPDAIARSEEIWAKAVEEVVQNGISPDA